MSFNSFDPKFQTQAYFCIPRVFDSHVHLQGMGKFSGLNDLASIESLAALKSRLQVLSTFHSSSPSPENLCYIQAFGLNPDLLKSPISSLEFFQDLLKTFPHTEFCLVLKDGHSAVFSGEHTNALILQNKINLNAFPSTVFYLKHETIFATMVGDQARQNLESLFTKIEPLKSLILKSNSQLNSQLLQAQSLLLQQGFTHCRDMTSDLEQFQCLLDLESQSQYFLYTDLYFSNFYGEDIESLFKKVMAAQPLNSKAIQVKGVKIFLDGSLSSCTIDSTCSHYGPSSFNYSFADVKDIIALALDRSIPLAFHCIGDLALQKIIQGFKELTSQAPSCFQQKDHSLIQVHLEHCEFINDATLKLLQTLTQQQKQSLHFHFQPSHWNDDHTKLHPESNLSFFAWEKIFSLGFKHVCFGSDAPVTSPLFNLESDATLLPYLKSKFWGQPWWKFFTYPDPLRGTQTFTLFQVNKNHGNLMIKPHVFVNGQKLQF